MITAWNSIPINLLLVATKVKNVKKLDPVMLIKVLFLKIMFNKNLKYNYNNQQQT